MVKESNRIVQVLSRITSSNSIIREVDGLRFIAIISVLVFHIVGYLRVNIANGSTFFSFFSFIGRFLKNGSCGVELFFAISGFILCLPMIKKGTNLFQNKFYKKYLVRRISRLEVPYILAMSSFLILHILLDKIPIDKLLTSFLASMGYMHNFIFAKPSIINTVAWTLEIEFQFYLLAPLLVYAYSRIQRVRLRQLFLAIFILTVSLLSPYQMTISSILSYGHFFLIGLLIADIYVHPFERQVNAVVGSIIFCISTIGMFYFGFKDSPALSLVFSVFLIGSLYSALLLRGVQRTVLSWSPIYLIGGMCYSIYLLHYPLISFVGPFFVAQNFNPILTLMLTVVSVLIVSTLFFLLIEKPTMIKKWYTKSLKEIYFAVLNLK